MKSLLQPGETCWRVEKADAMSVIVDAAHYFRALQEAMQQAKHSVLLIGWDFDTRIELDPNGENRGVPSELGKFLKWIVKRRPELQIHLLKWDLGMAKTLMRGSTPIVIFNWATSRRVHVKLDSAHPVASAHHQKIVVIDDTLAFCGGIDMTADRWDTREHRDDDPRRKRPTSRRKYGPWHDVTTAISGEAARALGDMARLRWHRATGEELDRPPEVAPIWPESLTPLAESVDLAIARTLPEYADHDPVHEIEALYLKIVENARETLYIESQYFASRKVADAIARRLREPDGPEIVVVNPESADGWLEEAVMGSSRAKLLKMIEKADLYGRFRLYTPVTAGRQPIYVHAKVLVMDDMLLRVGSSNLNNRSMGYDTECDVAIAAEEGEADLRSQIIGLRDDLIAEHLDVEVAAFRERLAAKGGSLIRAIDSLLSEGRSLVLFEPPELNVIEEEALADSDLLDPERPAHVRRALNIGRFLPWVRTA